MRAPALVAGSRRALWRAPDGAVEELTPAEAAARARASAAIVCHGPATARRLGVPPLAVLDVLELFAFARPAAFCSPTPRGLAAALALGPPRGLAAEAGALVEAARALLAELAALDGDARQEAASIAATMAAAGWAWGGHVLDALGAAGARPAAGGLDVWARLPEWSEQAPLGESANHPVEPAEARARLAALIGPDAEPRPQQADYASAVSAAFQPRETPEEAHVVLAEAGTGVGKTLAYIAPASLWAEKNQGAVWLSTFTKNLQRQLDQELDRLYPEPRLKARKAVIRKGRENYLCLLNLEEAARALAARPGDAVALGLMARWARATRDGDMGGGDFPSWLAGLVGRGRTVALTDRRGECIYSACPHYRKCFIERGVRRARRADIVIANHALVMTQAAIHAALGGVDPYLPTRYVFDEGHHVFDAADGAFSAHLSGVETAELRRWVLGAEDARRGRARGLKRRLDDLVDDDEAEAALEECLRAARALPGPGWLERVPSAAAHGPAETFLSAVRRQVLARARRADAGYSLEADARPPADDVLAPAAKLDAALGRLARPLLRLGERLADRLDADAAELDTPTRLRIEAMCRGLARRGGLVIAGWREMLAQLAGESPERLVDWFAIERIDGREVDVAMHRHWVDPTAPFVELVVAPAHGVVVTSATLRDGSGEPEADWRVAEARTGADHLARPAVRAAVPSPFDYAAQTRTLVVTDVNRAEPDHVAAAYRELFLAAGGGALGLFTAIARLRAVHGRIVGPLEAAGLALHAQHVDALDTPTLVDIFRAEEDSCLLGTDAVRDGIDVPGRSLRLIVFDRVPWPRPDLLHRARRRAFGGSAYDDMLARSRLKQAFGRLVRRADDRGVFVLLDAATPSRLAGAFPDGAAPRRVGLAEAIAETGAFVTKARGVQ